MRGFRLIRGRRRTIHPVGVADPWVSLRRQAGNADDALLRRLYGPQWRQWCGVPPGRRHRHALVTAAGALAVLAWLAGARRPATLAGLAWLAGTAEFAARRIVPGPSTPREVATMAVTSVAIPPLAVGHYLRGWLRYRSARPLPAPPAPAGTVAPPGPTGIVAPPAPTGIVAPPGPTGIVAPPAPTGIVAPPAPTGTVEVRA
jgi:hypothetical protein